MERIERYYIPKSGVQLPSTQAHLGDHVLRTNGTSFSVIMPLTQGWEQTQSIAIPAPKSPIDEYYILIPEDQLPWNLRHGRLESLSQKAEA